MDGQADPGDPCSSYQWSIVYCFIMALALCAWTAAIAAIVTAARRRGSPLSWPDRAACLLAGASLLQFGPLLASSLHSGHGIYSYSQTGCKLMFYTEYGTRHVVTALVGSLLLWAHWGLNHGVESADGHALRLGLGWVLLGLAAIQGLFGMVPAMYVDLSLDGLSCAWTPSMSLSLGQVVSMEVLLRPVTPYLLPGLLALPLIVTLARRLPAVAEETRRSKLRTVLAIVSSFFLLNLPYAVHLLVVYGLQLTLSEHSYSVTCNLKWFFFLVHQSWFLLTPLLLLLHQPPAAELPSPSKLVARIKKVYEDKARLI